VGLEPVHRREEAGVEIVELGGELTGVDTGMDGCREMFAEEWTV
jgi:hypothetical protein